MKNVIEEIEKTRKIIRQKYEKLKQNIDGDEIQFARKYKPIIEPLTKIATNQTNHAREIEGEGEAARDLVIADPGERDAEYEIEPVRQEIEPARPILKTRKRKVHDASAITDTSIFQPEKYTRLDDSMQLELGIQLEEMLSVLPKTTQPYIAMLFSASNDRDYIYGPMYFQQVLKLGTKPIVFENDKITIGNRTFPPTVGLHELIFKSHPKHYNEEDLLNYKDIIQYTDLHKGLNNRVKSNRGYKYTNIIKPLLSDTPQQTTGKGLFESNMKYMEDTTYEFWNDPNELVERLRLLISERNAGNNNHQNEIYSILEELSESGFIINRNAGLQFLSV